MFFENSTSSTFSVLYLYYKKTPSSNSTKFEIQKNDFKSKADTLLLKSYFYYLNLGLTEKRTIRGISELQCRNSVAEAKNKTTHTQKQLSAKQTKNRKIINSLKGD